jgi:DNA-binding NarL/FixJ family response regulator
MKVATEERMKRILVVDDHPVVREGMARLLESQLEIEICGSAGTARDALIMVAKEKPDLVLADMTLPDRSGLELIKDIKTAHPEIPVLVISMHDENLYAERVLRAGGRGYVMKETASEHLLEAVQRVLGGEIYLSEQASQRLAEAYAGNRRNRSESPIQRLTDREFEVFQLIGNGKSTRAVGEQLHISPRTVDAHRAHIKKKLGLENGNALVRLAVRWVESGDGGSV